MSNNVHSPKHYQALPGGFQVWDLILKMGIGKEAALGNVLKYVLRFQEKNGLEDLEKAHVYLTELIRITKGEIISSMTGSFDEHLALSGGDVDAAVGTERLDEDCDEFFELLFGDDEKGDG